MNPARLLKSHFSHTPLGGKLDKTYVQKYWLLRKMTIPPPSLPTSLQPPQPSRLQIAGYSTPPSGQDPAHMASEYVPRLDAPTGLRLIKNQRNSFSMQEVAQKQRNSGGGQGRTFLKHTRPL